LLPSNGFFTITLPICDDCSDTSSAGSEYTELDFLYTSSEYTDVDDFFSEALLCVFSLLNLELVRTDEYCYLEREG